MKQFKLVVLEHEWEDLPSTPLDWGDVGDLAIEDVKDTNHGVFATTGWLLKDGVVIEVEMLWEYDEALPEDYFPHGRSYDEETFWKYYYDAIRINAVFPFRLEWMAPKEEATIMVHKYDIEQGYLCDFLREQLNS